MSAKKKPSHGEPAKPKAPPKPAPPFDRLRRVLAALRPTGDDGFEGLIAAACTQLAGVPFRLVGSGRQFGRDAEGLPGGATVMMEAKRYNTKLSYDALSAKLLEALERSRRNVEVWCAAATVAFDAADSGDLRTMGETRGTTVLVLDWAQPLPPLGVMLAAARETVVDWFARNAGASAADVERELASIRAYPLYDERAATVRAEFRGASIGLAVARRGNAEWMDRHFSEVLQALHRFNQPLAPLDGSMRPAPLERAQLEGRIRDAIGTWSPEPRVVVLTGQPERGLGGRGDEGVGKSWAAARSWLTFPDAAHRPRPMLLFMTPHMWREGDERAPMALLARLAAEQTGASTAGDPVRWQTKLERWLTPSDEPGGQTPAIVLVLDGVNERIHHPWVPLISALALEARSKRLSIVVTTRRGIYDRDFAPRLKLFDVREIPVETFSDDELDHLLVRDGKRPEEVREPLRSFLRNPRVLSVGLDLLDRLDPDEVGIERLLFEYLRKRQDGRSLAGGHTAEQLEQVLVRHAREVRERLLSQVGARQSAEFEDRTIHDRLGLPAGQTNLAVDLGDIVDSGFIRIVDGRRGKYALRENGRLLGLGLLVVEELAAAVDEDEADLDRLLEAIIDPIRAIDETALVLLSALDVAIADPGIRDEVAAVLLHQVLTLQNIPAGQQARIFAGLSDRPEVFTRVAGRLFGERSRTGRREWMRDKLVEARDRQETTEAIDLAVRNWLRAWQREPSPSDLHGYGEEQAANARKAYEEATSRHEQDLQELTAAERTFVEGELVPLPAGYAQGVDELAIAILSGRSLAAYADELFAWCVAAGAGWEAGGSREAMYWLRRLAPLDWDATTAAVGSRAVEFLKPDRSRIFQWAIEYALTGSGDSEQARKADEVWTLVDERKRNRETNLFNLPDVDPLDPEALEPDEGMDAAVDVYRSWTTPQEDGPPSVLMRSYDSPVARVRYILCRFRPRNAADLHRDLAARCSMIEDVSPTVVAGFVHHDTAILAPIVDVLVAWMEELRRRPDLPWKERQAPYFLLAAVLPHLDAERQFDLHAGQRDVAEDAFWLGTLFKPLPEPDAEARIRAADAVEDPLGARLTLIATADAGSSSAMVRRQALDALRRGGARLRAAAFRAMMRVGEERDDREFAAAWRRRDSLENQAHEREDFWGSLWFARITRGADDPALLDALSPSLRSQALEQGGPRMLKAGLDGLAQVLRETGPDDLPPKGLEIDIVRSDDIPPVGDPTGSWHLIGYAQLDDEFEAADGTRRRMRDINDYFALVRRLASTGRELLLHPFTSSALDRAALFVPDAFERLAALAEEFAGTDRAGLVSVLAHDIARILSHEQPMRAARLFTVYEDVQPSFPEVMPISQLSRSSLLLWRSADHPAIVAIRHRRLDTALDDTRIATEILAAEMAGRRSSIVRYVSERMAGRRPDELARAVTAAGFAVADAAFETVFADERFRHGFLEIAARKAKRSYDLARWSAHWHGKAREASDDLDLWSNMELATACADARCALWLQEGRGGYLYECLRASLPGRYAGAVSTRSRERRGTLFGQRKPAEWMTLEDRPVNG